MRLRILLAACVVFLTASGVALRDVPSSPAPSRIVATAASAAAASPAFRAEVNDTRSRLAAAIAAAVKADELGRFYAEMARQDEEAAVRAAQRKTAPKAPAAVPVQGSGSAEDAIRAYFGDIFSQAWGVSGCESGHDPSAVSPGGANWGLFQINTVHKADFVQFANAILDDQEVSAVDPRRTWEGGVLNAWLNTAYARKLYDGNGGWGPWSCAWAA